MSYGLPTGASVNYGAPGFPDWVYQLGQAFNLQASTYPGHQETNRVEAGFARNPQNLNRGIDWAGSAGDMQRFADYLMTVPGSLEQVIFQNPQTGQQTGLAGGRDVTQSAYYADDYPDHTDHVHTRQSEAIPMPGVIAPPTDTLFADVSEWQVPVDDSYPYSVISIRSNDGTYRDKKWANNYAWCCQAADSGKLAFFLVYFVWRPGVDAAAVLRDMCGGAPHPKMAVEIDIESWGGQITGDQSAGLNASYNNLAAWLGDPRRVVGYGNTGDLNQLWPSKPAGMGIRLAAYGSNPDYPGRIAHQYTDGSSGFGGGLPEGAPPFGNCDMNSADGYTPEAFAAACGIAAPAPDPDPIPDPEPDPGDPVANNEAPTDPQAETVAQVRGRWEMLGWQTPVEALAQVRDKVCGTSDAGKTGFRW